MQELYGVRSDLGNLYKALGRLEEAKVGVYVPVVPVEGPSLRTGGPNRLVPHTPEV